MKAWQSTLAFAVVAGLVGGGTYYLVQKDKKDEEAKSVAEQVFGSLKFDDIVQVELKASGKELILKREDSDWRVVAPIQDFAEDDRVEGFVGSVLREKLTPLEVEGSVNWNEYGLEAPGAEVTFTDKAGKKYAIMVGAEPSFDGRYFIRKMGEGQLLIGETTWETLTKKDANQLRARRFLRPIRDVGKFTIKKSPHFSLSDVGFAKTDDNWGLVVPNQGSSANKKVSGRPLDQTSIGAFVTDLRGLEATDFVGDASDKRLMKEFGLDRPAYVIEVTAKDAASSGSDQPVTLYLSAEKDGFIYGYSSVLEPIFKFSKSKIAGLEKSFDDFRDKRFPFGFEENKVAGITLQDDQLKLSLKKNGDTWVLSEANDKTVDQGQVKNLIQQLGRLRVDRFLDGAKDSVVRGKKNFVDLVGDNGQVIFSLIWGDKVREGKENEPSVYLAKTSLAEEPFTLKITKIKDLDFAKLVKSKDEQNKKNLPGVPGVSL